jgi:hypothetical protein
LEIEYLCIFMRAHSSPTPAVHLMELNFSV